MRPSDVAHECAGLKTRTHRSPLVIEAFDPSTRHFLHHRMRRGRGGTNLSGAFETGLEVERRGRNYSSRKTYPALSTSIAMERTRHHITNYPFTDFFHTPFIGDVPNKTELSRTELLLTEEKWVSPPPCFFLALRVSCGTPWDGRLPSALEEAVAT